jgi:nucleotide-binding universal stress UspA family protein
MKILVCYDGTKYSEKALLHACELARNFKSSISLIYVVDSSIGLDVFDRKEYLEILRNYGKKVLQKGGWIASQKGIDVKILLKEGKVVDQILKTAKKDGYNLIVAGSKGLGTFSKIFLGSVSSKLAHSSLCSILIVK